MTPKTRNPLFKLSPPSLLFHTTGAGAEVAERRGVSWFLPRFGGYACL